MKNVNRAYPKISLKAARVNAGLHQRDAAKALGINVATLQHYENGKTVPDVLLLPKIESVYKFPADYIFFGRDCALSESAHPKPGQHSGT